MSRRDATVAVLAAGVLAGCVDRGIESTPRAARSARAGAEVVGLPAPSATGGLPLTTVLSRRRSVRSFAATALTRDEIGQLFWAAQGVTHDGDRRTAPSAGALYPLESYAVTADWVLRYLPPGHRAERWPAAETLAALAAATPSRDSLVTAPAVFVISGVNARTARKYGSQATRYVDLEIGHAAQNLLLQAVALGLGAVPVGALDEDRVAAALGLPAGETARYLIPVGRLRP